jgi:hypothetical protein
MPQPRFRNTDFQEYWEYSFEHAAATADATHKLYKVPAGRVLRLDAVDYNNITGLTQDTTNFFNVKVTDGTNIAANWSTQTSAQGTLAADTFVALVMSSTDDNKVFTENEIVTLFLDESGDTTLPAGRIILRGRFIK